MFFADKENMINKNDSTANSYSFVTYETSKYITTNELSLYQECKLEEVSHL
jgi:hypothetical protein